MSERQPLSSNSWALKQFPDLSPGKILRDRDDGRANPEELRRANWLWKRRPTETMVLIHLLVLGIGALGHAFFIFLPDPIYLMVYHTLYVLMALVMVGRFVWAESQYRRWKQDYLRSVVRLAKADGVI
jgi:hypothetical protein